jgi:hypothetical protein
VASSGVEKTLRLIINYGNISSDTFSNALKVRMLLQAPHQFSSGHGEGRNGTMAVYQTLALPLTCELAVVTGAHGTGAQECG